MTEACWAGETVRLAGWLKREPAAPRHLDLLLRERDKGRVLTFPAITGPPEAEPAAGAERVRFEASVHVPSAADGGPLPSGLWDLELAGGEGATTPLGRDRDPAIDVSPQRRFLADSTTATLYFTVNGTLAIDVGGQAHTAGTATARAVEWNARDEEITVTGHLAFHTATMPISATLTLREHGTGRVYEVIAMLDADSEGLSYKADIPMTRALIDDPLPRGTWDAYLILGFAGMHRELRVMAPDRSAATQVWRRLRHVRVSTTQAPAPLTIQVG
ncbi:hypothetical protein GCM10010411_17390 [Actinomadura fulvescens]|uniref:Uncharacterized protein n=1 Tax=Actinomadura fulvescens TaxID=46160 RepID=A0ABN3PH29_9ACTN